MDLIPWRHAEAHEATDGQVDADRPLSAKGGRQAARMAQWLHRQLPESPRLLVGPTPRTRQSADARHIKYELVPAASVEAVLRAVR